MKQNVLLFQRLKEIFMSGNPEYYIKRNDEKVFQVYIIKDYGLVNDYLAFANSHIPVIPKNETHYLDIKVSSAVVFEMSLADNYLAMNAYTPTNYITLYVRENDMKEYAIKCSGRKRTTLLAYDDGGIVTAKGDDSMSLKYYPTTVKNVMTLPVEAAEVIMGNFSKGSLLYKDFLADRFFSTLPVLELHTLYTKADYFKKEFPDVLIPKTANKLSCDMLYAICCAAKYIKPEQVRLLFQKEYQPDNYMLNNPSKRLCKSIATNYITRVFEKRIEFEYGLSGVIDDYISMAMELKEKIDIQLGKKGIHRLHDEYSDILLRKTLNRRYKKITLPETPLKYLKLPECFHLLDTVKALCEEQKQQHNCVASYAERIIKGKCVIYAANIDGEHLTIEIVYAKSRGNYVFKVKQCLAKYNQFCKKESLEFVKQSVQAASENAIKQYQKITDKIQKKH